ncbi:hypothetical protein CVT25_012809 [Psilocybe cyanescens]|uniref:Uncharacterized protein n=1 Tax=Psilocybe cyanescens TaxID=93625 RepID=A0A409XFB3_PSICY|nr:hypothetical protein CVT25_012809 [Psilocybe cyanescens]
MKTAGHYYCAYCYHAGAEGEEAGMGIKEENRGGGMGAEEGGIVKANKQFCAAGSPHTLHPARQPQLMIAPPWHTCIHASDEEAEAEAEADEDDNETEDVMLITMQQRMQHCAKLKAMLFKIMQGRAGWIVFMNSIGDMQNIVDIEFKTDVSWFAGTTTSATNSMAMSVYGDDDHLHGQGGGEGIVMLIWTCIQDGMRRRASWRARAIQQTRSLWVRTIC